MVPEDFAALELSHYELKLRACQSASLPAFLGSTLRGAFGHALKEAVCVMDHRDCARCLVADRCIYPYLFETPVPDDVPQLRGQQQAPHPFILTPPISEPSQDRPGAKENASAQHLPDGRMVWLVRSPVVAERNNRRHLRPGDVLVFSLTLIGRATEYLPYVVYAVSEMARRGLGFERARFELSSVALLDESGKHEKIYTVGDQHSLTPIDAVNSLRDLIKARLQEIEHTVRKPTDELRLRFRTPIRIRVEGDLQASIRFELLIRNLLRRISVLTAVHGQSKLDLDYRGLIARAETVRVSRSLLSWHDWERYSNRQETKMKLGGFIGEIEYAGGAIEEFMPLIIAGEILHVGAGTSFGLGKYDIAG